MPICSPLFAVVNASIILAFVVFCLESESGRRAPTATAPAAFWSIDVLCTALFVFDYAARLFTCVAAPWAAERLPGSGDAAEGGTHCCARGGTSRSVARNLIHFLFAPLNMIDAVATFPTVAALAMGQTDAVRRLLALRVLR